jgi:hypothetical protein
MRHHDDDAQQGPRGHPPDLAHEDREQRQLGAIWVSASRPWILTVRRLITVTLASVLVAAAVLRSHLLALSLLALMGALVGLLVATQMREPRDLLRVPVMVSVTVLVLVGIGQLGVLGIIIGVALLIAATPTATRS